jgi:hypothetical protein
MIRMLLAAALMATVPVTASTEQAPLVFMNYPMVGRVDCDEGRGSAFRIAANHWISAAHVTALHNCSINGSPITVTEQDGAHDFSRFDAGPARPGGLKINCHGFIPGEWYWASGHARGLPFQTAIALYATYAKFPDGKRVLIGPYTVIPGMSGGAIMNGSGEVVGLVNAYIPGTAISLSRELKSTSVCGANIA